MSEWANEKHGRDGTTPQCSGPVRYEHLLAFRTGLFFFSQYGALFVPFLSAQFSSDCFYICVLVFAPCVNFN